MVSLERSGVWRIGDDVAEVRSTDHTTVLRLGSPACVPVLLEGTAFVIWQLIDGFSTVSELVAAVSGLYGVSEDEVQGDVMVFLRGLADDGLIYRNALR